MWGPLELDMPMGCQVKSELQVSGMVVHACNPGTWVAELGELHMR